ncbi:MAG: hypothetical protein MJZ23_02470 [Paludibacteraceae bacterium]|nr:hypothetical protein [Paludibacteraceae bacterium]
MNTLVDYKLATSDNFQIEYDIVSPVTQTGDYREYLKKQIEEGLNNVESQIEANQRIIDEMSSEIDRLTNHADGIDYTIAVTSGVLCGLIDSFFVGEFSFDKGTEWGTEKTNNFVKWIAEKNGYDGDSLEGSVRFLEQKFPFAGDSVTNSFGGGSQHHFRDFSHHASPIGLLFSLITQFTGKIYGIDTRGGWINADADPELIGKDIPRKLFLGFVQWFFHLVSDVAGSSGSIRDGEYGTGLPGPFLSLLTAVSALPCFNHTSNAESFSHWLSHLFNGTLLADKTPNGAVDRDALRKFDLRAEMGVLHELGRQAIPVIINEVIVRFFYFARRLYWEFKEKDIRSFDDFIHKIEWKKTLPCNNRTINRMLTIASGTFVAVDLADAAIRSGLKSGGEPTAFLTNMVLRVNFVGIGRFAIAVYTDLKMGYQRRQLQKERWYKNSEQIFLYNAKVFYKQGQMWIAAEDATKAVLEMEKTAEKSVVFFCESLASISDDLMKISRSMDAVEFKNPGLLDELSNALKY